MCVMRDKEKWRCQLRYKNFWGETKRIQRRGFATEQEAKEWEEDFLRKYDRKQMLFKDLVELYLEDASCRVKCTTLKMKKYIIESKILPVFGERELQSIEPYEIRRWQNEILKQGYADTYVRNINNYMSALFSFAEKFVGLTINPSKIAGPIGSDKVEHVDYWKKEEYDSFHLMIKDKPASSLAFNILFWTGMRVGEMLALTVSDIDLKNRTISITKCVSEDENGRCISTPKTSKSYRTISIPLFLVKEIKEYFNTMFMLLPGSQIFKFTNSYMHHEMRRGCKLSGVRRIRIHDLRHSHASMLINMNVNIYELQNRLGHERVHTTIDKYCHLYPDKQAEIADKLDKIWNEENESGGNANV